MECFFCSAIYIKAVEAQSFRGGEIARAQFMAKRFIFVGIKRKGNETGIHD